MSPTQVLSFLVGLLDFVVSIIGREKAKDLLSLDEVQKAHAMADAIEIIRFGKTSQEPA